jgi:predicted Zn-dependent peptidase
MTASMDLTKDALSEAVEALRARLHAGQIDEAEFRAARDALLERRRVQRPYAGPDRRATPPTP